MRIVVDITHPCDVNFFRVPIARWEQDGHDVKIIYLDRGSISRLLAYEYRGHDVERVGAHASTRLGLYVKTGLLREIQLTKALAGRRVDVVVGFPGFQTAIVAKIIGAKSLGAYDDPEHRPNMLLSKLFCDRLILPEYLGETGRNVRTMRALKEWAHLSPRYFTPNPAALEPYGLTPKQYVFVREIEPRSLNYADVKSIVPAAYAAGLEEERVLLSLEDKSRRDLYPRWTILEEPVADIASLMFYSKLVISSGDSMAREGVQLGVPSVYVGGRLMRANEALRGTGLMHYAHDPRDVVAMSRSVTGDEDEQRAMRARLMDEWEDVPDVLTDALHGLVD